MFEGAILVSTLIGLLALANWLVFSDQRPAAQPPRAPSAEPRDDLEFVWPSRRSLAR